MTNINAFIARFTIETFSSKKGVIRDILISNNLLNHTFFTSSPSNGEKGVVRGVIRGVIWRNSSPLQQFIRPTLRLGVRFLAPQPLSATNHFYFSFFCVLEENFWSKCKRPRRPSGSPFQNFVSRRAHFDRWSSRPTLFSPRTF